MGVLIYVISVVKPILLVHVISLLPPPLPGIILVNLIRRRLLFLLWRWLKEDVSAEDHTLTHSSHKVGGSTCRALLLLLLSLFVFFLLVRCRLTVIISEVDLICEFDSK